jgi:AraC-like DNA-binding protein
MESPATLARMRLMDWRSLNAHLLWAYQGAVVAPAGTFRNDHLVAWRLLAGRVEVKGEETVCHAQAGEWMFPPSRHDQRRFSADAQLISIHFQARWADGRLLFEEREPTTCSAADFPELDQAATVIIDELKAAFSSSAKNLAHEQTDFFTYLKLKDTLPRWLSSYARARLQLGAALVMQGTSELRVLQGLEFLNNWPVEKPLHAAHLASQLNLSMSQLNRLFVAETGKTPLRHFDDRRMEVARNLLRTSTLQVKEIAYTIGFRQPAHFSNWFFKKTGAFPLSCRRTLLPPSQSGGS